MKSFGKSPRFATSSDGVNAPLPEYFPCHSPPSCVPILFMTATTTTPDTPTPDTPSRSARLLGLVHKLIDYGKELAATIRRRAFTDPQFASTHFGSADAALILASISRGLHRANALEARIVRGAARLDAAPRAGVSPRNPRVPRPAPAPAPAEADPRLARLPPRRRSPPRSAAARSVQSWPISAATSASCPAIRCGGSCNSPSSARAAISAAW
jgi:hypothetical protein